MIQYILISPTCFGRFCDNHQGDITRKYWQNINKLPNYIMETT